MTTEIFYVSAAEFEQADHSTWMWDFLNLGNQPSDLQGWYWWSCEPGCLPDGDPDGPYPTRKEAEEAADSDSDPENW